MGEAVKTKFARGVVSLVASKMLAQAASWIISLVVVRLLAPQEYGLMGMAVLFSGFLLLFSELGLGSSIVQRRELDATQLSSVAWAVLLFNAALFTLVVVAAPFVASYFREPELTRIVRVLGLGFLISAVGMPSGFILAREMEFGRKARAEFVGSMAGALTTLALAATGFGVWSLVAGYLTQLTVLNGLYCLYRPIVLARSFSLKKLRPHMNFGLKLACSRLLWYASANADFLIVGRVLGTTQLGYYSLAFQLATMPIDKGVSIVTQVALPLFSPRHSDDAARRRQFLRLVGVVALVTTPAFLGLSVVADAAVLSLLPPNWSAVVVPLQILCVVSTWRAIVMLNAPVAVASGRPGIVLLNSVLQVAIMPCAFYLGASYGLTGVAIAWVIAWPIPALIMTYQTLRAIGLSIPAYVGALKHPFIGSAVMVLGITLLEGQVLIDLPPTTMLLVVPAAGAILYGVYIGAFHRAGIDDLVQVVRSARSGQRSAPQSAVTESRPTPGLASDAGVA